MGKLILAEWPLTVTPPEIIAANGLERSTIDAFEATLSPDQQKLFSFKSWEDFLQSCLDQLTPESGSAFLTLANSHTKDGSGPLMGVIRTNAFAIKPEES
jgi:hypothetical protein